jgi:hypothetical protein
MELNSVWKIYGEINVLISLENESASQNEKFHVVCSAKGNSNEGQSFKKNWQGSTKCCFCDQDESVQHLFVKCPFAKLTWQIFYMAFNITPLWVSHIFWHLA